MECYQSQRDSNCNQCCTYQYQATDGHLRDAHISKK